MHLFLSYPQDKERGPSVLLFLSCQILAIASSSRRTCPDMVDTGYDLRVCHIKKTEHISYWGLRRSHLYLDTLYIESIGYYS